MATPTNISAVTHLMAAVYDERDMRLPSVGFQTLFARNNPTPTYVFDSESFSYDIVRHGKKISKMLTRENAARSIGSVQKANVGMKFQNASNVFPSIIETASVNWTQTLQRVAGEDPYGNLTRFERLQRLLVEDAMEGMKRIAGRVEKMAVESVLSGTITLDDTAATTYTFNRSTNNTFAAGTFWTDSAATPLADLDTLAQSIHQNSGIAPDFVVMGRDSHTAFINNASVKSYADNRRYYFVEAGPVGTIGALPPGLSWMTDAGFTHTGNVRTPDGRDFPIFIYLEQYQTDAGVWTDYLESKSVLMGSSMARLNRFYGPSITMPPSPMEEQAMMSKIGIEVTRMTSMPANTEGVLPAAAFNFDFNTPTDGQDGVFLRSHIAPIYVPTAVDAFGSITATVA